MTVFQKIEATKLNQPQLDIIKSNIQEVLPGGIFFIALLPPEATTLEKGFQFLADKNKFEGEENVYGAELTIKGKDEDITVFIYVYHQDLSGEGLFVVSSSPKHPNLEGWLVAQYPYRQSQST